MIVLFAHKSIKAVLEALVNPAIFGASTRAIDRLPIGADERRAPCWQRPRDLEYSSRPLLGRQNYCKHQKGDSTQGQLFHICV